MRVRSRTSIAILVALGAIALGASAVLAKGGATVALTDPISREAQPGTTLTVEFTVMVPGDNGPTPMIGSPVFVRLIAPDGSATEGFGTEDRGRPGTYRADVVVPAGGISSAEFGLRGSAYYPDGRVERSDIMFVAQGKVLTDAKAPAAGTADQTGTTPTAADLRPAIAIAVGGLLLGGLVLATRRRRLTRVDAR